MCCLSIELLNRKTVSEKVMRLTKNTMALPSCPAKIFLENADSKVFGKLTLRMGYMCVLPDLDSNHCKPCKWSNWLAMTNEIGPAGYFSITSQQAIMQKESYPAS